MLTGDWPLRIEVRRVVYTSIAIDSLNSRLGKIISTRRHIPSDDAASTFRRPG